MVKLTGNNLPERQRELNIQVNEAAFKNIPFDVVKAEAETTDVDKLFKIDLAAKYRNIEYVIETLKMGDSLYITRVLNKCLWLYDDEFSNIFNTDYLHHNIFPFMSLKMKRKLLTTAAVNIKNDNRAADFYHYCIKTKQNCLAYKFLIFTSESFKLETLHKIFQDFPNRHEYLKNFIGDSFALMEAYLLCFPFPHKNTTLLECSYLYNVSDIKYLDLLEKQGKLEVSFTLGLRISKDIVVKHKKRIIDHPDIYLHILNLGKLLRHSSLHEVEFYSVFLLPKNVSEFWRRFNPKIRQIISVVPENERYAFAKKIFENVYHNEEFEMSKQFYDNNYLISLMTPAEREEWALQHIRSGKEILGSGNDYIWYKFMNFEKAFAEIRKCILTATDKSKRSNLLEVLIQSANGNQELEKVLQYYYERHVNEKRVNKIYFLRKVIGNHNVFKFDDNCWSAFNKILHSVKVYDTEGDPELKVVAVLYNILNDKAMPEPLIQYMETSMAMYSTKIHIENEDAEGKVKVYEYLFKFYLDRILEFEPGCKEDKAIISVHFLLELMAMFKKTKRDIPDKVMEFINHDSDSFKYQRILQESSQFNGNDLIKLLKKDPKQAIEKLPQIKNQFDSDWNFHMKLFTNKLKVYFSDSIAKEFIKMFTGWLKETNDHNSISTAVFGLIQLNDEVSNIKLLNKYVPESAKKDWEKIDKTLMSIQEYICRFICYSRPPVPLSNILMYLKGDYVNFCLPMFNRYLTNLPTPLCLKFVESLLDSPVSIQKHGLRLAFQCIDGDNLYKLILNTWKNTKNVSVRKVIYKALFEKVVNEQDKEMCKALITLTLDLHDTDDDDVFSVLNSNMYNPLPGDFIAALAEAFWTSVREFGDNDQNIQRKVRVIEMIERNIDFIKKEITKDIVSEHVKAIFRDNTNIEKVKKHEYLNAAKWKLVTRYIEYFISTEVDLSESVEMVKLIVNECFKRWNDVVCEIYVFRKVYCEFITDLDQRSYVPADIFEAILVDLQATLPLQEIYIYVWTLRIIIASRRVVKETRMKYPNNIGVKVIEQVAAYFGTEVGNMVKEAAENKTYFAYFSEDIKNLICNAAYAIRTLNDTEVNIEIKDIELAIACGLLELNAKETNLLALLIVPLDKKKCNLDLYKSVYNKLKESADPEIQCCMVKKFSSDCKRRRLE